MSESLPMLVAEVRQLIADARLRAATALSVELTWLYWQVGQRIHRKLLGSQRAGYGEEIVSTLSRQLSWSHLKELLYLDDPLKRDFYAWTQPASGMPPLKAA